MPPLLKRLAKRWLVVLIALPFVAVGAGFLFLGVIPDLADAHRTQSWEQGEARLTRAGVETHSTDDGTTYEAYASYTYEYEGRSYTGTRVAISDAADNIGSFQQNLGRRLQQAYRDNRPVTVWINPDNPGEAVLDRTLRWEMVGFKLIFIVLFGGGGIGIIAFALLKPTGELDSAEASDKPWLTRRYWAGPTIESQSKTHVWIAWFFAVGVLIVAVPVSVMVIQDVLQGGELKALVVLLFPLAGIGLLAWAIRTTLAWRRFGKTPLTMDPYPGAIGGQAGGTVDLKLPYDPRHLFQVTLTCVYSYMSGSGKNRSRREDVKWQSEGYAHAQPHRGGTRLEVLFDVDEGLPASDPKDGSRYHLWRIQVHADLPGVDFDRSFEIPVFSTGEQATALKALSTEHARASEDRMAAIESVLDIQQIPGGVKLYYPPLRHPIGKLAGILGGGIFAGGGILVHLNDGPLIFPLLFIPIGALVSFGCLYSLLVGLWVKLDGDALETVKQIFGIDVSKKRVPRGEISHLQEKKSYSSSAGKKHKVYYKLQAVTLDQKTIDIGYNLVGLDTARQALESLSMLTGVPSRHQQ